ncbi:MAG: hypothetical protein QXF23_07675 [Candidatus Bathyarchaeia archaeon]
MLPLESREALAASIKSELYPYYAKMMRELPPESHLNIEERLKALALKKRCF